MRTLTKSAVFMTAAIGACLALAGTAPALGQDEPAALTGTTPGSGVSPDHALAQQWVVRRGSTTITFDEDALAEHGLRLAPPLGRSRVPLDAAARRLTIQRRSTLTFSFLDGSLQPSLSGVIQHLGDLALQTEDGVVILDDLRLTPPTEPALGAAWTGDFKSIKGSLIMTRVKAAFDPGSRVLSMRSPELRLSRELAAALGRADLADLVIGTVLIRANTEWSGGAKPEDGAKDAPAGDVYGRVANGPDMTFCQLYGLYMPSGSRLGDAVGLSLATTSWNVGTEDLMWFSIPDEEHPFIVMNLYRLKNDRFEQIGQSHIKHGFFALGSHQCGGPSCSYEPGHGAGDWLGTGCTDTYGAGLNAVQSGMGPKYEVNPWTGYWYYPGSHMQGGHSHDPVEHRIFVRDADLDPAQNPGAAYFAEGYYVCLDDVDVMNSASWKPVTVSGTPGGTWSFGMSSSGTPPVIGFAIDAWSGASQTLVAQQIPVVEFISPDGRCMLAAKAKPVSGNVWHYEYALLNIDMDRQVGSFSIPIPPGSTVTNVGFHAPEHYGEPVNTADPDAVAIDNAPWVPDVTSTAVTWSTTTNPIRWASMYSFRFDIDAPPATVTSTVGMFRIGLPAALFAETTGPAAPACPPDLDGSGAVDVLDLLQMLAVWGPCIGCGEDLNGDDVVDVLDLLDLLAAWGPC